MLKNYLILHMFIKQLFSFYYLILNIALNIYIYIYIYIYIHIYISHVHLLTDDLPLNNKGLKHILNIACTACNQR